MSFDENENENLKQAIEDLMETINEKEMTIVKASNIIENLKTDFEAVLKQLRSLEQEKEDIQKENNQIFKENQRLQKEANQVNDTYRKYEEKMKKLHRIIDATEQREKKLQQIEQQLVNEVEQLQIYITLQNQQQQAYIKELKSELGRNIEMAEDLTQQYKVKETGFSNAFDMLQQYENQIAVQISEINNLKQEKIELEQDHKKEIETLKRVTQNLVKSQEVNIFGQSIPDLTVPFFGDSKSQRKSRDMIKNKSCLKRNSSVNLKGRLSSKENLATETIYFKQEICENIDINENQILRDELNKQLEREKVLVEFLHIQSENQIRFLATQKQKTQQTDPMKEQLLMKCNELETRLFDAALKSANLSTMIQDYKFAYSHLQKHFNNLYSIVINYIQLFEFTSTDEVINLEQFSEKLMKIFDNVQQSSQIIKDKDILIGKLNFDYTQKQLEIQDQKAKFNKIMIHLNCQSEEQIEDSLLKLKSKCEMLEKQSANSSQLEHYKQINLDLEEEIRKSQRQLDILESEHLDALKAINDLEARNIKLNSSLKQLMDEYEIEQLKNFSHEQEKEQLKTTITRGQKSCTLGNNFLQEINLKSTLNIEQEFFRAREENSQSMVLLEKTIDDLENLQIEKEQILEKLHFTENENNNIRSELSKIKFQLDNLNTILLKQLNENIKCFNTGRIQTNEQRELFQSYPFFRTFRQFHETTSSSINLAYTNFCQILQLLQTQPKNEAFSLLEIKYQMSSIPQTIISLLQTQFGTFTLGSSANQELIKFVQFTNEIAVRLLEIQDSKDAQILERLEKIIYNQKKHHEIYYQNISESNSSSRKDQQKYKTIHPYSNENSSFNSQQSIKQMRDLQTCSCQTLITIFKVWKDQIIAIAELFYEISLSLKGLSEGNKIDSEDLTEKIEKCFEIIESQLFIKSVQTNFDQLEISAQDAYDHYT